ncbi:alpha/beta hydrolase family protein [Sphingobacterium cellulitidis]|uniref:alpha/beta hydrolase family protein n=1 Tax=Sphingobacterium cellulitidis TaxID=1768011 RepID=UPI000B93E92B|nr:MULTISPECIES: prolyl oligopeptidase family serine peptidase [Sphingobacterium]MBA8987890.1 dipeptidyl aminopeptidase/acylaminoacyl peptidase [Sphingobacterium soli]OYD41423.1 S9 family peptidase [Sphingobacterium cellulitidis]OYD46012.1 S9 family peptidase [Sphingobacterium cellulitidis]
MKCRFLVPFLLLFSSVSAQENVTFQKPSAEILQLADFKRPPSIQMSSDKKWVLSMYRPTYKTLSELGLEETKLAGLRINAKAHISSTETYFDALSLSPAGSKEVIEIALPENPQISNVSFSPDSKKLAFTNTQETGVALFVYDLEKRELKKLTDYNLNAVMHQPFMWYKNSDRLLLSVIEGSAEDKVRNPDELPTGPVVSSSSGQVSQLRTYQDLLKNPQDERQFENLVNSKLVWLSLDGSQEPFRNADLHMWSSVSPDGQYVLVTTLKKPFSYVVTYGSFPSETNVYDLKGNLIKQVNATPLMEVMPKGFSSTRPGKRSLSWRTDKPATLAFVQALDGGDANKPAEFRDELFVWDAPFNAEPKSLIKIKDRYAGTLWGNDQYALVYSQWYDTRNGKTYLLDPSTGKNQVIYDLNVQDIYSDPGTPYRDKNQYGAYSMYIKNGKSYWIGDGYTKEGEFPFIDEYDFKTQKKKRIYTAKESNMQERISSVIDIDKGDILVSLQSPTDFPNYYSKNIKSGKQKAVTEIANPFQSLDKVHKEVLNYKRKDGVDLSGTLYLPAGYDMNKKEKLPLLIWAYPREYKDKNTAGQSTNNPKLFTFPSYGSFIYWVAKGYAVLDNAAFPIVGEGTQEPNDNFIEQLVGNAEAAINAVDELGYVDKNKVAVGGHSYGAFMTAHLLSNSKLFAAGIARSGAYNRTLTPFGFQSEQRNLWDDPNLYITMSPFFSADKMKTPMLLVHGAADNNPGTFTLQTERYFQALKNLGAPVRMVLLPRESHGYAAKENIFHLLWEQDQFLEKYVKNKQ